MSAICNLVSCTFCGGSGWMRMFPFLVRTSAGVNAETRDVPCPVCNKAGQKKLRGVEK